MNRRMRPQRLIRVHHRASYTFIVFDEQKKDEFKDNPRETKPLKQVTVHLSARTAGRENKSWELKVGEVSK